MSMIETEDYTSKVIEKEPIDSLGIKMNPDMVKLIYERIIQSKVANRGLNIMLRGDLCRGVAEWTSKKHGEELNYFLSDIITDHSSDVSILPWEPKRAYNGPHKFWFEGFKKRVV
jgi:hypothetical protein